MALEISSYLAKGISSDDKWGREDSNDEGKWYKSQHTIHLSEEWYVGCKEVGGKG